MELQSFMTESESCEAEKTGPESFLQSQIILVEPQSSAYSCQTDSIPRSHYLFSHS